ncbi:MAG: AI-2E family transporter [Zetaproteobacteria bacterium]|nr:AI-2E family transporter [Zetaproteobacteria bacterium]
MQKILTWLQGRMADQQLVMLLASLFIIFALLLLLGDVLAPLLVAIALAYVFDGIIDLLNRCRIPRILAVILVVSGALLLVLFALLTILPLLTDQVGGLIAQVPQFVVSLKESLQTVHANYVSWVNPDYLQQMVASAGSQIQAWSGRLLSFSIASIPGLITLLVYAVLVPVLVFFLLKDKGDIVLWAQRFLPQERSLLQRVWSEVDIQIGNYIRGKVWESVVVGLAMWLAYEVMGHEYALLLGTLTGISVWIPFVGAAIVTIPVILLSYFQWGWSEMMFYGMLAYTVIQLVDANIIVPWIFSEVVNLHPIAIVVAVLVFGSFWGVLGVFIAIPMAALVQSVLTIIFERKVVSDALPD